MNMTFFKGYLFPMEHTYIQNLLLIMPSDEFHFC